MILANGQRAGFFIGDGAGVGKGRQVSDIVQSADSPLVWPLRSYHSFFINILCDMYSLMPVGFSHVYIYE